MLHCLKIVIGTLHCLKIVIDTLHYPYDTFWLPMDFFVKQHRSTIYKSEFGIRKLQSYNLLIP